MSHLPGHRTFRVFNQEFVVDDRYKVTKELGQGAYGIVCAATDRETGEGVAIKKVTNIFSKRILTKRALREIRLLQHFRGHRNITCLFDMDIPRPESFNECYLYEELMECDLAAIIRSGQPLTDSHFQSFVYQILCGLKYIHSANVLHRDLKPGNLLVNADCELKICDFGLARGFSPDPELNAGYMTEYVATRWYRAPEIMLSFQNYTKAIDIWSVGCILAELLGGKPFFKGRDYVDQLNQILNILGTPDEETLSRLGSPRAQEYVRNLPFTPKVSFKTLFPNATPLSLDILDHMLAFDPAKRINVEEALKHEYLHVWHDPSDEPICEKPFDFSFEAVDDIAQMRTMIMNEVTQFRTLVRRQNPSNFGLPDPNKADSVTSAHSSDVKSPPTNSPLAAGKSTSDPLVASSTAVAASVTATYHSSLPCHKRSSPKTAYAAVIPHGAAPAHPTMATTAQPVYSVPIPEDYTRNRHDEPQPQEVIGHPSDFLDHELMRTVNPIPQNP